MFDIQVNEPIGFSVKSDGHVITTSFNGFLVSPESVTRAISSMRNAIQFRNHEKWAHVVTIKNGKSIKTNLRQILLNEFDWWFLNGCVAFAICLPKDDIKYVESVVKTKKNRDKIKLFDIESPEKYLSWVKYKINRNEKNCV